MIEKTIQCHMEFRYSSIVLANVGSRAIWGFCAQTDHQQLKLPESLCRGPWRETLADCQNGFKSNNADSLLVLTFQEATSFYPLTVERVWVFLPWHHGILGLGKGHWSGSPWYLAAGAVGVRAAQAAAASCLVIVHTNRSVHILIVIRFVEGPIALGKDTSLLCGIFMNYSLQQKAWTVYPAVQWK